MRASGWFARISPQAAFPGSIPWSRAPTSRSIQACQAAHTATISWVSKHLPVSGRTNADGRYTLRGVASFPQDAPTREALFQAADLALYAAKQGGRNAVQLAA